MIRNTIIGMILLTSLFCGCVEVEQTGYSNDTIFVEDDDAAFAVEGRIIVVEANNTYVQVENMDVKQIKIEGDGNTISYSSLIDPTIIDNGTGTVIKTY